MPWDLKGNRGVNSATDFLGTVDSQPLVIKTNEVERTRVTPDGKIGIGIVAARITVVLGAPPLFIFSRFFFGEELLARKLRRTFQGCKSGIGPYTLQVRMAVRCVGRTPALLGDRRCLAGQRHRRQQRDPKSHR